MVDVAQWLEYWIVVPVVGGSSPLIHPIPDFGKCLSYFLAPESGNAGASCLHLQQNNKRCQFNTSIP